MRICLFSNPKPIGFFEYQLQAMYHALLEKGVETLLIDFSDQKLKPNIFSQIVGFNPDFTCYHHSMLPFQDTKTYLSDLLEIPHVTFLVDPPIYRLAMAKSPFSIFSCVDRNDVRFLNDGGIKAFFLPHAIDLKECQEVEEEKIYDVIYIGFCTHFEKIRREWLEKESKLEITIIEEACENVFDFPEVSIMDAILDSWERLGQEKIDFRKIHFYVDHYTRGKDRVELLRSIKEAKVHVFGGKYRDTSHYSDWGHFLSSKKNIILHDSVPFESTFSLLRKSKICLNSTPFFKSGSHERILLSLASNAIPISSENSYLKEEFEEGKELFLYPHSNREIVNTFIENILSDESRRQMWALQGKEKVKEKHTWKTRISLLIQNLEKLQSR